MAFASLRLIISSHFLGRNRTSSERRRTDRRNCHPGSASVADAGTIRASRRARIACPTGTRITWATRTRVSWAAGAIICCATRTIVFPPTWPRILWSAGPVVRAAARPSVAGTSGTSVGGAARTLISRTSRARVAGTAGAGVTLAIASIPSDGQTAGYHQEDRYQYELFFHETAHFQSWPPARWRAARSSPSRIPSRKLIVQILRKTFPNVSALVPTSQLPGSTTAGRRVQQFSAPSQITCSSPILFPRSNRQYVDG